MIKAVLDTNVWLSGMMWKGVPHRILQSGARGKFSIVVSPQIIQEVQKKLIEKFRLDDEKTDRLIKFIRRASTIISPISSLAVVIRDPSDNKIIECAIDGDAGYIVTGDKDLLSLKTYRHISIVTPSAFSKLL